MSAGLFRVGMQMRARELQQAVRTAETMRLKLHNWAVGIAAVGMPGERTGLWGVAVGRIGIVSGPLMPETVGDARSYEGQIALWRHIGKILGEAREGARGEEGRIEVKKPRDAGADAPDGFEWQIVVSSRQAARLLAESASRFRYVKDEEARNAAEVVWWCLERREFAGSHAAVVLTETFALHWATGEDGGDPDDLRLWLPWLQAAVTGNDLAALKKRYGAQPPDPITDPKFDAALWKNLERGEDERSLRVAYRAAEKGSPQRAELELELRPYRDAHDKAVSTALKPVLGAAWKRLVEGWKLLANDPRPRLAALAQFCAADEGAWVGQHKRREKGKYMARRDSLRRSVHNWFEMAAAKECWEGALVWGDRVARIEAVAAGRSVTGEVVEVGDDGFVLSCAAGVARVRAGDRMAVDVVPAPVAVDVMDVSGDGERLYVTLEWSEDRLRDELGDKVELLPALPDFTRRNTGWVGVALSGPHWAIEDKTDAAAYAIGPVSDNGGDPLAEVEALRRWV
jgi:hypothetical protein